MSAGAAGEPVSLTIGGNAHTGGTTDLDGNYVFKFQFFGDDDEQITVEATVGPGSREGKGSAVFTITRSTVAPGVSVKPASGTSPTFAKIRVTDEPFTPVTLEIGASQTNDDTNENGIFEYRYTFKGPAGEVKIKATVGDSGNEETAATSFEITPPQSAMVRGFSSRCLVSATTRHATPAQSTCRR